MAAGHLGQALRRLTSSLAVATFFAATAILLFAATPAPAEGEVVEVEGGDAADFNAEANTGMPASNPRVRTFLDSRPNDFVTVCVAGCAGKPSLVQALPMPHEARSGSMRTTVGRIDDAPGRQPEYANYGASNDAVTCVAGCGGRPGQVVQRLPGLPSQPRVKPPRAPAEAEAKPGNEPLDARR